MNRWWWEKETRGSAPARLQSGSDRLDFEVGRLLPLGCTLCWSLLQIRWPETAYQFPAIAFVAVLVWQNVRIRRRVQLPFLRGRGRSGA